VAWRFDAARRPRSEGEMGKKPAERPVTTGVMRNTFGFEAAVPCGTCGAPSRRSQKQFRVYANGHTFTKKSDQ
jgi:hypothetical protein